MGVANTIVDTTNQQVPILYTYNADLERFVTIYAKIGHYSRCEAFNACQRTSHGDKNALSFRTARLEVLDPAG